MVTTGYAFLSPTPEYPDTFHLYIIISIVGTKAIMVNVTTNKTGKDASCVLQVGDHDFITHESVINYGDVKIPEIDKLKLAIDKEIMIPQEPISDDLLNRIINGAKVSNAFPQGLLKHLPVVS